MAMTAADADDDAQRRQDRAHDVAPQGVQGDLEGADRRYIMDAPCSSS